MEESQNNQPKKRKPVLLYPGILWGVIVIVTGVATIWQLNRMRKLSVGDPKANSIVTHRVNAGTLGLSGWYHADSTEGNFAVDFPSKFNDFTFRSKMPDGKSVTTGYCLQLKSKDGVKMTAIELTAESRIKSALELLEESRKKGLVIESRTRVFDQPGAKVVEWLEQNSEKASYFRLLDFAKESIILSLEYPTAMADKVEPYRVHFFSSLVIREPSRSSVSPP
jgi:hypothetical protein